MDVNPSSQADEIAAVEQPGGSGPGLAGEGPGLGAGGRRRRRQEPKTPIQLDPQFVNDPQRMQYALLLALLLRHNGTAKFSKADMDHVDTDYNILFARTLDGHSLEVTVVSAESGIIRSPEKQRELELWNASRELTEKTSTYPPYHPLPSSDAPAHPAAAFFALHGMDPKSQFQGIQAQTPGQTPQPIQWAQRPDQPQGTAAEGGPRVVPFPQTPPTTPADGSAAYTFPFQVGDRPETSQSLSLDQLQSRLMQKEQQVQQEEQAAIQRMEEENGAS